MHAYKSRWGCVHDLPLVDSLDELESLLKPYKDSVQENME